MLGSSAGMGARESSGIAHTFEDAALGLAVLGVDRHHRVGADRRPAASSTRHPAERPVARRDRVAAHAICVVQPWPVRRQRRVDRRESSAGQRGERSFDSRCSIRSRLSALCRGLEEQRRQVRFRCRCARTRPSTSPTLRPEALERERVRRRAVPLHDVVPVRVPQERARSPAHSACGVVPVVQVDARGAVEDHAEGVEAGAAPRLVGPARLDELREVLGELLELGVERGSGVCVRRATLAAKRLKRRSIGDAAVSASDTPRSNRNAQVSASVGAPSMRQVVVPKRTSFVWQAAQVSPI